MKMDEIKTNLLREVSDLHGVPQGEPLIIPQEAAQEEETTDEPATMA